MMKLEITTTRLLVVLIFIFFLDALVIEPNNLIVTNSDIDFFHGMNDSGVRIALISDFHIGLQRDGYLDEVVDKVNAQNPDVILIGGDSIESGESEFAKLEPLKRLNAPYGIYAVLGNHDYGYWSCPDKSALDDELEGYLEGSGITVLRNENRTIDARGRRFALIGVDDYWSCNNDYDMAARGLGDIPKVVLVHNQASVDFEEIKGRSLVLSGHTHCGQVQLPFITGFFLGPSFGKTVGGYERLDSDTEAYVTCGVTSGGIRFLSNPEISVIDIK